MADYLMFKYNLKQKVFYMSQNQINTAYILQRLYVDGSPDVPHEAHFGLPRIQYVTHSGYFSEDELFASMEDLLRHLRESMTPLQEY